MVNTTNELAFLNRSPVYKSCPYINSSQFTITSCFKTKLDP